MWLCCLGGGRIAIFSGDLDDGQCRAKKTEQWLRWTLVMLGPEWGEFHNFDDGQIMV